MKDCCRPALLPLALLRALGGQRASASAALRAAWGRPVAIALMAAALREAAVAASAAASAPAPSLLPGRSPPLPLLRPGCAPGLPDAGLCLWLASGEVPVGLAGARYRGSWAPSADTRLQGGTISCATHNPKSR
jgi:hypothetical protein